jgi:pyruvate/2-oxoglutarate dehydrogenase complex dihydrolipoamide dehydrogenase (E3) component
MAPDAVIFATGSGPFVVDLPGVGLENVISFADVLGGERQISGKKVVVWGAGLVGCETAYFLAEKGNEVTLVFPEPAPAPEVAYPDNKKELLKKVTDNHVNVEAGVREFKEITPNGIRLMDRNGKDVFIQAEYIVLATGARPNRIFSESEKEILSEPYEAGDCVKVRRLLEAVHEGAEAGLKV